MIHKKMPKYFFNKIIKKSSVTNQNYFLRFYSVFRQNAKSVFFENKNYLPYFKNGQKINVHFKKNY